MVVAICGNSMVGVLLQPSRWIKRPGDLWEIFGTVEACPKRLDGAVGWLMCKTRNQVALLVML